MAGITFSVVNDTPKLVKRFRNDLLVEQAYGHSPALKYKHIPRVTSKGKGTVNIRAGGNTSTGQIDDGGDTEYVGTVPKQLQYDTKVFYGGIRIGRKAAKLMKDPDDGVALVKAEIENEAERLGQMLGKAVFGSVLAVVATATTANTDTTTTVADPSGFEIGMAADVYNAAGAYQETVTITDIAFAEDYDNATTLTFSGTGTGGTNLTSWLVTHYFTLKGAKRGNDVMDSLSDAASATASLYGLGVTEFNWKGNEFDAGGPMTITKLDKLAVLHFRRRKIRVERWFMDAVNARRYVKLNDSLKRFTPMGNHDARGETGLEFDNAKIVIDDNVGSSAVYGTVQKDFSLHVAYDFGPDDDDEGMHLSEDKYDWLYPVSGAFGGRCERRVGCSKMTGITS